MSHRFRLVALAGATIGLCLPAVANASNQTVFMGPPPKTQEMLGDKYGGDVNAFFPSVTTINVGNTVTFTPGFHNVDFPAKGQQPLPFIIPTGDKASGASDAAGAPFWFNGQDIVGFNPAMANPDTTLTHSGSGKRVASGIPVIGPKPKPIEVKFTRKGSFNYWCDVHPGMKGRVNVLPRRSKAPTKRQHNRAIRNQVASAERALKRLRTSKPPAGIVNVGVAAPGGVEYFQLVGPAAPIKVGTTLRFQMTKGSYETHTATTGPGNPMDEKDTTSYLNKLAATFQGPGPFDPIAIYPSDQPGGTPASLTPQLHGNGFWNSGAMDTAAGSPLPSNNSVRFDAPGTYTFWCLIHPFMKTTITVES